MNRSARIYVAGHTGLVGSALLRGLRAEGYTDLITRTHSELDLERQAEVETFFEREKPEYVFLAAAKVGGIWANLTYPAEFIYSNLAVQTNVIHAAWKTGVKRLLFLGSSCVYPRDCPQPMKEEYLLTGPLEPTNEPYAVAKIAGIKMCQSYNRQYGTRFLAVMPTNLYGPNDNFDLETSHVLPALIRKFHLAKLSLQGNWQFIQKDEEIYGKIPNDFLANLVAMSIVNGHKDKVPAAYSLLPCGAPEVILWGTGTLRREFLHVDDLAEACTFIMRLPEDKFRSLLSVYPPAIINIGSGHDQTIHELADLVASVVNVEGKVEWDAEKPHGTPQKLLDISRLTSLRWQPRIPFVSGIRQTYTWYQEKSVKESITISMVD
jgi:GDP-L-fucose synthase